MTPSLKRKDPTATYRMKYRVSEWIIDPRFRYERLEIVRDNFATKQDAETFAQDYARLTQTPIHRFHVGRYHA